MVVKVVIGANYGDEGKGHMTQYFASEAEKRGESCIVVLSNGGSQRGHTVMVGGTPYVVKHYGSGMFNGADTYIPKYFVCEPCTFLKDSHIMRGRFFVDPESLMSTPYDIYANQIIETERKDKRHGSCGMGIWETVKRKGLTTGEMLSMDKGKLFLYLRNVRDYYLDERLKNKIDHLSDDKLEVFYSERMIYDYMNALEKFGSKVTISDECVQNRYDRVIYENGQGLLLSQKSGEAGKYTTPSNTGLRNPAEMISELSNVDDVEVCYVTRTYLTRHGAGPMEDERDLHLKNIDKTNVKNMFQGSLRTGLLNQACLDLRTELDSFVYWKPGWRKTLAVTYCDETDLYEKIDIPHHYESFGPAIDDVREV